MITIERKLITPTIAADLLQRNEGNRPLKSSIVNKYVDDMVRGQWLENAETIKFDVTGRLLDGQHRLQAVSLSGRSLYLTVAWGVESAAFATIDAGCARSAKDVLAIMGVTNGHQVAGTVRFIVRYHRGLRATEGTQGVSTGTVLALLRKHPEIRESVARTYACKALIAGSIVAAVHFLGSRTPHDAAKADKFVDCLSTGEGLQHGHPALMLRNLILRVPKSRGIQRDVQAALLIKAWNAFYTGRPVGVLRYDRGDAFPALVNCAQDPQAIA